MTNVEHELEAICARQPYPLLFATLSGAHLYGFASSDSDFDLRGVHLLPARELLGLRPPRETIEEMGTTSGLELDLVTHDAGKFMRLLLRPNGYVLEQLHSPLVVRTTAAHAELKRIAAGCITRHHAKHYLGFARNQRKLLLCESPPRLKPLLYSYRVLLTGIHLMCTSRIEASLPRLNEVFRLSFLDELVARKREGKEGETLRGDDLGFHERELDRLAAELERLQGESRLPEKPAGADGLHALLVELRLSDAPLPP